MPLPGALTTCVLTGTYLAPDGTALAGQVSFIPTSALTDPTGSVIVSQTPVAARLQAGTGSFSITLPCTDNADLSPEGWQWQAVIQIPGATTSFFFLLPSTLGDTADISALTPAGEPPAVSSTYVTSINGQSGAITLAVGTGIVPPAGDIGGSTGSPTVTSTHLASPLPVAQGGTAAGTQQAAINSLTGTQAAGHYLRSDGTNASLAAIQGADVPTLNQSTTGTAAGLSSTLAISSGGTGQVSQQAALNAIAGAVTSGDYLRGNGTNVSMSGIQAGDVPTLNQSTTGTAGSANALNSATTTVGVSAATAPISGQVLTATSGTAATWQNAASGFANPMTTLGDIIAENSTPAAARIAGNATATKNFLTQTGTGSVSALPSWGTIAAGDVPTLNQSTTGTAAGLSATLAITSGGTGQASAGAAYTALSPMTTLGDLEYEGSSSALRLAGPISAVKNFLTSTGTGSAATAPAWGTLASGDLPAATTSAQGAVILDGTAGDIKATGAAAASGSSTKAAAADHVHVQCFAGALGDGSDGAVVLDGTLTYSFLSKASSTYTFTRDTFYTNLTVNSGVTLNVGNSRTYCTGTLTNNGNIVSNGNAGQASGTAGTAASNWSFHAGTAGGAGNTGAGTAGTGIAVNIGGASGGTGGTGSGGAAGAAGTNSGSVATHTEYLRSPAVFATGQLTFASASQQIIGGCGGGGGSGDGTNHGGGGGAGGGVLGIAAAAIVNNGVITATGGAGGTPATGNCGGGGGGGGGVVWTFSLAAPTGSGSMTAAGGAPGTGVGTGTSGSSGSAGTVLNVILT